MEKIEYLQNLLNIFPISLFEDNYSYLIVNNEKGLLVDPAQADPVLSFLKANHPSISITHILLTHKHWDHAGEVDQLIKELKKVEIIAGEAEQLEYTTIPINKETNLYFNGINMTVIPTPCHTKGYYKFYYYDQGHVLYYMKTQEESQESSSDFQCRNALFTGDTLFIGGCGRFFEGNGEQMLQNFDDIAKLPLETKIFCGHEYTVSNFEWSTKVDSSNQKMKEKLEWAQGRISKKFGTIPSTIKSEIETNIFMRCRDNNLQKSLNLFDPVQVMEKLREMKNSNLTLV